jgi:FkbM family methyltransferase
MKSIPRPAPFVLLASGQGTLIVNRHDYRMVDEQRGYGVGFQLFSTGLFEPEEVQMALSLLETRKDAFGAGVIAIDCGANIGVHTVEWARAMHGWGEVIAVEAQERIFYALAGNIAINNCFNARAIHAAVGAAPGTIRVPQPDYLQPSSFGSLELRGHERNEYIGQPIDYSREGTREISMVSIDSFALPRLDFIKIDVEGMELEVLDGAQESIEKFKPQMLIEVIKTDRDALLARLAALGYRHYPVGINILAVHQSDPCAARIRVT